MVFTGISSKERDMAGTSVCTRTLPPKGHKFTAPTPSRPLVRKPLPRKGALARPQLVEGVGVIEAAVFHDLGDALAIADIGAGVGVEDDQVGELAGFEA